MISGLSPDQEFSRYTALRHTMTNHISQLLAKFHQNLMKRFEDMAKNANFWPILTLIPYNPVIKNFFQKSAWNIFLLSSRYNFVQSF